MRPYTQLIALLSFLALCCCSSKQPEESRLNIVETSSCDCLLDNIKNADTLKIRFDSRGCFHQRTEILRIYVHHDQIMASLNLMKPNHSARELLAALNDSTVKSYANFEEGQHCQSEMWCTTKESFTITTLEDTIHFRQDGCDFDAFEKLKENIFGHDEMQLYYTAVLLD